MISLRHVKIENKIVEVFISDEKEALKSALAAGRAVIGLINKKIDQDLSNIPYLAESMDAMDDDYISKVARRYKNIPWTIVETDRLIIREFSRNEEGILSEWRESTNLFKEEAFTNTDILKAYIENQYYFYEYGLWALVVKETGSRIGQAGICNYLMDDKPVVELSYYMKPNYRSLGFAKEACNAILYYSKEWLELEELYCRIEPFNERSIRLACKLGFRYLKTRNNMDIYSKKL